MASTSDDSDEAVWKRQLKTPIDPKVRLDPDKWRTKQRRVDKDPRKFEFAIVCKHCSIHRNSLGGMKIHLDYCPKRKRPDLLCGHCKLRVNDWPTMVRHLNRKDMERQLPCEPKYKMDVRITKLFPTDMPKYRHCALKVLGHESRKQKLKQRYNAWLDMHPTDIKSFRKEAANVRRGVPKATFKTTPARYSTENSPCEMVGEDIVTQAVKIARIGGSSVEQSPGILAQTTFETNDQGGGVVAFMEDAPPTFNVSQPPLIALGTNLSDHSDVEPADPTPLSDLAPPASTCSIADNWTFTDSRGSIISLDTLLRQSCPPESASVETVPSHVVAIPQSVSMDTLSWRHSSPESRLIPLQPAVVSHILPSVTSLLRSSVSAPNVSIASQLSSLVSPPVVSDDGLLLGEVEPEPILQSVMSPRPESDCVGMDVPPRLTSSPARSAVTIVIADDHGDASSCLNETEMMVKSSIPPSTHTPVQLILGGGELSHAALVNTIDESSSKNTLGEPIITADADSSTDTDTPNASVPIQHHAVVIKTEANETITLSSSDGEDAVGISPISDVTALRRQVSELRRQRQRDLRQLVFWSDTVAKLGTEIDRPPTGSESRAREKLISSGDWPSYMESVKTASFRKLGGRFADFYRGSLHSLFTD